MLLYINIDTHYYYISLKLFIKIKIFILKIKQIIIDNNECCLSITNKEGFRMAQEYNRQYLDLKSNLRMLKSKLISNSLNGGGMQILAYIEKLAKELDIKYFDEQNLDEIETKITSISSEFIHA
jgi:hypothetical protein